MVLFVFQFYPVCYFGKFVRFGLGTVRNKVTNPKIAFALLIKFPYHGLYHNVTAEGKFCSWSSVNKFHDVKFANSGTGTDLEQSYTLENSSCLMVFKDDE